MPKLNFTSVPDFRTDPDMFVKFCEDILDLISGLGVDSSGTLDSDNLTATIPTLTSDEVVSGEWTYTTHPLGLDHTSLSNIGTKTHATLDTEVGANTTHISSAGTDHSDVVLNNTHRSSAGTDHSDVVLNNTHRSSDGKNHSDVVLNNTHRTSAGTDHSDVVSNTARRHGSATHDILDVATDPTDAAAATVATLTDSSGGSKDNTVSAITAVGGSGATTTQEGEINNNFAEVTEEINALRVDVADIRSTLNTLLANMRTANLI